MTSPYYEADGVTLFHGDCLHILPTLPDASVDAIVTDPPYGLEFMGKEWDAPWKENGRWTNSDTGQQGRINGQGGMDTWGKRPQYQAGAPFQAWCQLWAAECLRVLKPGGHLVAFGGTRTYHRMTVAIEDAGFEVRDSLMWLYGSGFPKSHNIGKAIDKAAGATRDVIRPRSYQLANEGGYSGGLNTDKPRSQSSEITAPATPEAQQWDGWGTALKPAYEPIVLARKPLVGTVAANVLQFGTGGLNVDGCRIGTGEGVVTFDRAPRATDGSVYDLGTVTGVKPSGSGRWPANVTLDPHAAAMLDQQSGPAGSNSRTTSASDSGAMGWGTGSQTTYDTRDAGGASRFYYVAKADASERPGVDGVVHPTVKPVDLMQWLVRLVTPPGGLVLEPFAGSGTTAEACLVEGMRCIAIEREATYLPLIVQRVTKPIEVTLL